MFAHQLTPLQNNVLLSKVGVLLIYPEPVISRKWIETTRWLQSSGYMKRNYAGIHPYRLTLKGRIYVYMRKKLWT